MSEKCLVRIPKSKLQEKTPQGFTIEKSDRKFHGVVIKKGNHYFAYENRCCHLPVTLDLLDNDFLNEEGDAIQCHMHGAVYEMETGHCIAGPCLDAFLNKLQVIEEGEYLCVME